MCDSRGAIGLMTVPSGVYRYGLYRYGLYGYGLDSYGLYSCGHRCDDCPKWEVVDRVWGEVRAITI